MFKLQISYSDFDALLASPVAALIERYAVFVGRKNTLGTSSLLALQ